MFNFIKKLFGFGDTKRSPLGSLTDIHARPNRRPRTSTPVGGQRWVDKKLDPVGTHYGTPAKRRPVDAYRDDYVSPIIDVAPDVGSSWGSSCSSSSSSWSDSGSFGGDSGGGGGGGGGGGCD